MLTRKLHNKPYNVVWQCRLAVAWLLLLDRVARLIGKGGVRR